MVTYKQPTKNYVRLEALSHAVDLLTRRRDEAAIASSDYVERIRRELADRHDVPGYADAANACSDDDVESWRAFRQVSIGTKRADELTVAYLAGPEPFNDLTVLLDLGIRAENIWAFENQNTEFRSALAEMEKDGPRGVKLMRVSIEDYLVGTPRRFDIIYLDACGALPSHEQKTLRCLANVFRYSSLTPLGVLITNFSKPDVTAAEVLDDYAYLVASYLYPKGSLDAFDDEDQTSTDSASADGCMLRDDDDTENSFFHRVRQRFDDYYGSYITRQIMDLASIIAPTVKLLGSDLRKALFVDDKGIAKRARWFVNFSDEEDSADTPDDQIVLEESEEGDGKLEPGNEVEISKAGFGGDAITTPEMFSLLWTLTAWGLFAAGADFSRPEQQTRNSLYRWANQLCGKPEGRPMAKDVVGSYYTWRSDRGFWSEGLQRIAAFPYDSDMPLLCDKPTREIGFYPAFAQLAYPTHCNVREARRFSYVAEGKSTTMYLDVLPFDECRYTYDWLSALHLVPNDWRDVSAQLTFRFALDAIAKTLYLYQDDFLYGCHVVGVGDAGFDESQLSLRRSV